MWINSILFLVSLSSLNHELIAGIHVEFFSAAAATIVKIYYFKGLSDHADITLSWSPITLWYT